MNSFIAYFLCRNNAKTARDNSKSKLRQSKVEKYNNYLENSKQTEIASVVYESNRKCF